MQLIRGFYNLPDFTQGTVVTIGAFDGVHIGHQALLKQVLDKSRELKLPSVVICFEPLPREYFCSKESPSRLMNFREKFTALTEYGIDYVLRIRFNERLRQMSADEFIEHIFIDGLHAKHITIGDDFRFGRGREGGRHLLEQASERYHFSLSGTPSVLLGNTRISSSLIRQNLEQNDFETAKAMLGKTYTMAGKVVYGRQLGRTLGFPTANVQIRRHKSAMSGVYIAYLNLEDGQCLPAVANVGTRPTVDNGIHAVLEVHALDYKGDLYGQHVSVSFIKKLRNEKKFASLDELQHAINEDAQQAQHWFNTETSH